MNPQASTAEELYSIYLKHPSVSTDSRAVIIGSLFFALKGESFDGNRFADEALRQGAVYAVVDNAEFCRDERYIFVEDTLVSLQEIARLHRNFLKAKVIGITGSNGKTTTKELINEVLAKKYITIATEGNLNNHIGVPLTILRAGSTTDILVVEMGANHIGEIALLCEIAKPSFGIITNIGKAHLEGFGSPEGVVRAKGELYQFLGYDNHNTIIVNACDDLLYGMAKKTKARIFSYGTSDNADLKGKPGNKDMFLTLTWISDGLAIPLKTRLAGGYNFNNVMAAIATGIVMDVDKDMIIKAIESYVPANNRSQYHETPFNRVIIDCYNANPASMEVAINHFLGNITKPGCLILGDMLELGEYADAEHRKVAEMAKEGDNKVIFVGKHFFENCSDLDGHVFKDTSGLILWLKNNPIKGYSILIKGSRGIGLERVIDYL